MIPKTARNCDNCGLILLGEDGALAVCPHCGEPVPFPPRYVDADGDETHTNIDQAPVDVPPLREHAPGRATSVLVGFARGVRRIASDALRLYRLTAGGVKSDWAELLDLLRRLIAWLGGRR